MPDTAASLTDQYKAQVTTDIKRVTQEREQVRAEILDLQQRLKTLEADHQQLLKLQVALTREPAAPVPPSPGGTTGRDLGTEVPRPRSPQTASRAQARHRGATAGRGETTWGEIILAYLAGQQEPQPVVDIVDGVSSAHPARTVKATVVRNTLEALVAKGRVQRRKQARSVTYSAARRQDGADRREQKQADAEPV
ncbi:BlaI/MecI/CopY family transcriptional regulator [Streptomyces triculaminicus]|uniref:BlaI/MecI/CopY family transcriptional regulator n=1 Tax=Streptomyces triculaminicus TaxID=2816232 RepID=UPI0037D85358